jgi:hypothetical protein
VEGTATSEIPWTGKDSGTASNAKKDAAALHKTLSEPKPWKRVIVMTVGSAFGSVARRAISYSLTQDSGGNSGSTF